MFSFKKYGEGPLQCIELNPVRPAELTVTARATLSFPETN